MEKKLTTLQKIEGFAEAQILYANQQEEADNKGSLRKVDSDTVVRRELAERMLEILESDKE